MNTINTQQTTQSEKPKRRRYDEQFKRDAVALLAGGRGSTQLACELGVSIWNPRDWKERHGAGRPAVRPEARRATPANAGAAAPWRGRWNSPTCAANSLRSSGRATF